MCGRKQLEKTRTTITSGKDKRKGIEVKCADIKNFFNNVDTTKRQEEQNEVTLKVIKVVPFNTRKLE